MRNSKEGLAHQDLTELSFDLVVPQEYIDANRHMNNARYLTAYEDARAAYFLEASGMTMEEAGREWRIMSVVYDLNMKFSGQLFEGDSVHVYTAAEPQRSFIRFHQRMARDGENVNQFNCRICLIDETGKLIRTIPPHIKSLFDKINSEK